MFLYTSAITKLRVVGLRNQDINDRNPGAAQDDQDVNQHHQLDQQPGDNQQQPAQPQQQLDQQPAQPQQLDQPQQQPTQPPQQLDQPQQQPSQPQQQLDQPQQQPAQPQQLVQPQQQPAQPPQQQGAQPGPPHIFRPWEDNHTSSIKRPWESDEDSSDDDTPFLPVDSSTPYYQRYGQEHHMPGPRQMHTPPTPWPYGMMPPYMSPFPVGPPPPMGYSNIMGAQNVPYNSPATPSPMQNPVTMIMGSPQPMSTPNPHNTPYQQGSSGHYQQIPGAPFNQVATRPPAYPFSPTVPPIPTPDSGYLSGSLNSPLGYQGLPGMYGMNPSAPFPRLGYPPPGAYLPSPSSFLDTEQPGTSQGFTNQGAKNKKKRKRTKSSCGTPVTSNKKAKNNHSKARPAPSAAAGSAKQLHNSTASGSTSAMGSVEQLQDSGYATPERQRTMEASPSMMGRSMQESMSVLPLDSARDEKISSRDEANESTSSGSDIIDILTVEDYEKHDQLDEKKANNALDDEKKADNALDDEKKADNALDDEKKADNALENNEEAPPPKITARTAKILTDWYAANLHHPYPEKHEVERLAREGGIKFDQVKKWFANKRVRTRNTLTYNHAIHPRRLNRLKRERAAHQEIRNEQYRRQLAQFYAQQQFMG